MVDLGALVDALRAHPGLTDKRRLAAVANEIGGDGDDAAILDVGSVTLAACCEAINPRLVQSDPRVAGIAGVVTAVNDLAASGARPAALLDTIVAPDDETVRRLLAGLHAGGRALDVPIVGGHTTIAAGVAPALSTFALGRVGRPLRAAAALPGDDLSLIACLEGELIRTAPTTSFFSHLRGPRRGRAAGDVRFVPELAEAGRVWAARDVSMPGLVGSALQLLESAGGLGCELDLAAIPAPPGVAPIDWLTCFPSFAFLVVGDAPAVSAAAAARGLSAARLGTLDATGQLRLRQAGASALFWDLGTDPLTGLGPG